MKKMFAIILTVACLLGMAVYAPAAEQNYCNFFEQEINMLHGQSEDVLLGETFSNGCITKYTNYREDFSAYDYTAGNVNFCIPADVYEAAAQKHFIVTPEQLRKRYNGYDEEENAYYLTLNASDDISPVWHYLIQGYEHAAGRYVAYFEKVNLDYRDPSAEPGLVEGRDYVLTWITDKNGNPVQKAALLLHQKLKVTMEYDGEKVKFLAWETIDKLPNLSGMTVPTAPHTTDKTTTAGETDKTTTDGEADKTTADGETDKTTTDGQSDKTTADGQTDKTTTNKDGKPTKTTVDKDGKTTKKTNETNGKDTLATEDKDPLKTTDALGSTATGGADATTALKDGRVTTTIGTTTTRTTLKNGRVTTTAVTTTLKNGRVTTEGESTTTIATTVQTQPLETVFETEAVTLQAAANAFPDGVVVNIQATTSGNSFSAAKLALSNMAERFVVYDITAKNQNATVQPAGRVSATFDIPEGFDASRTAIVYIAPGGTAEILVSRVDTAAGTVTAELSHFSTYAVAQLHSAAVAQPGDPLGTILPVAAVAMIVGTALCILFRKKGESAVLNEDTQTEVLEDAAKEEVTE